jgi:hypothetical protein
VHLSWMTRFLWVTKGRFLFSWLITETCHIGWPNTAAEHAVGWNLTLFPGRRWMCDGRSWQDLLFSRVGLEILHVFGE